MILMRPELAAELDRPDTLHTALQTAIELEHATIPVYLYALYSSSRAGTRSSRTCCDRSCWRR